MWNGIGIGIGRNRYGTGGIPSDSDAQAFVSRVETAGGILNNTEKEAVDTLVIDLKDAGIWTKMKAIYPMVGASAAACAQNLKSSSFTGTFNGGWTFASTGVTPNGTSAYMQTGVIPSNQISLNSTHISVYLRTNVDSLSCDISAIKDSATTSIVIYPRYNNEVYFRIYDSSSATSSNTNSTGFYLGNRISSSESRNRKNSTLLTKTVTSGAINTNEMILGAAGSVGGTPTSYSNRENAFASIGDGLTDTEASDLYTAVQAFNTTLSREV